MKYWTWLAAIVALAALSIGAVACGDDDDGGADDGGSETTATPAGDGDEGEEVEGTEIFIAIADFAFDPNPFTVPAGHVAFTVTNNDAVPHTFSVFEDEEYTVATDVSVSVSAGASGLGAGKFEAAELYFRCSVHPDRMQGEFTVE